MLSHKRGTQTVVQVELRDVHVERPLSGRAVVVFNGEHDLSRIEALRVRLAALVEENELVVADLSDAQFVDSAVIHLLVDTKRRAEASGRRFRIQLGTECAVYRVFDVAGVLSFLECAATRDEALGDDPPPGA